MAVLYGFHNLETLFDQRVTEVGVDVVRDAIDQAVEEHNRQMNALLNLFVETTTEFKERYKTSAVARLQPLDENGRALPIIPTGHYEVAYPLQMAGSAWGANYVARQKMTVEDANNITQTMLDADMRWVRDHVLAAMFVDGSWTYQDPEHGALVVKGPASGDTDLYYVLSGADQQATDDHLLATADAIADATDPIPNMIEELREHPENGETIIIFVPTNLKTAVEGLAAFHPVSDPNVREASTTAVLTGELGVAVPGEVFGYHDDGAWLVHWRSMPSDYLVGMAYGGIKPIRMRQEPVASLQGFRNVGTRNDHPFFESQWLRIAGFGAYNRVGVVVQRIGNANYAVPTNYTSPMP